MLRENSGTGGLRTSCIFTVTFDLRKYFGVKEFGISTEKDHEY